MIITINGLPGAGKTSVAKELAERLGFGYVSVGEIRGQMAIEKGITIDELNAMGTESDRLADAKQIEIGKSGKDMIVEGRVSWHLIPDSFKILVVVDPNEGARRIFEEQQKDMSLRADERKYASIDDARESIARRVASDKERLGRLYDIPNFINHAHFDFVIDTTQSSGPQENADKIIAAIKERGLI